MDAPIRWVTVDERHLRGVYTNGKQTVSATLTFDEAGDLIDFVSEDRLRASADGKSFTPQAWSTPLLGHRDAHGHRVLTEGEGRWQDPKGWFTYVELEFDDLVYNVHSVDRAVERLPTR